MAGAGTQRLQAAEAAAMAAGWQSQDWMWWSYLRQKEVASTGRHGFPQQVHNGIKFFLDLLCCQGNGVDVAMLLVGGGGGGCCCHGGKGPDGGGGGWLPGGGGGGGIIPTGRDSRHEALP